MILRSILFFLALSLSASAVDWALPAANQGNYLPGTSVGVVGGIDQYRVGGASARTTLIDVTLTPYFADKTGATDATAAINAAIAAVTGTDKVVYLPAGTYRIDTYLIINDVDNFTIRGDGPGLTTLLGKFNNQPVILLYQGDPTTGTGTTLVSGTKTKGTAALTVADSSGYAAGQLILVYCANEEDNARIAAGAAPTWTSQGYPNMRKFRCLVTAVPDSTHVTISVPLPWDATNAATYITRHPFNRRNEKVGIEDLTIDFDPAAHPRWGIDIQAGVESWVRNVEFVNWARPAVGSGDGSPIRLSDSYKCEVRYCEGVVLDPSGDGDDGFIEVSTITSCLIEDNIMVDFDYGFYNSGGTCNNVISYNYITSPNLVAHNAHPTLDLFEGNVVSYFQADGYHGSASNLNFYRNWTQSAFSVIFNRFNRQHAVAGNVMGHDGVNTSVASYGNPYMGNGYTIGTAQPTVAGDFWGDWKTTGTLTTRTSDTAGVVTVSGGTWYVGFEPTTGVIISPMLWWNSRGNNIGGYSGSSVTNVAGSAITMTFSSGTLPAEGTALDVFYAVAGWAESDLDVQASTILAENYAAAAVGTGSITNGTADTLPASLAYTAKPSWFGALTWPAINPDSPNFTLATTIPAAERYINGVASEPVITTGTLSIGGALTIGN